MTLPGLMVMLTTILQLMILANTITDSKIPVAVRFFLESVGPILTLNKPVMVFSCKLLLAPGFIILSILAHLFVVIADFNLTAVTNWMGYNTYTVSLIHVLQMAEVTAEEV